MNRKAFIGGMGALAAGFSGWRMAECPRSVLPTGEDEITVINAGVSGNNTRNLCVRLEADCLAHRPDLVIMMVGTNDMNHGKHVPIAEYEANLLQLAGLITQSGSKLLLLSILPFYEPYLLTRHPEAFFQPLDATAMRIAYNKVVENVASHTGSAFFDVGAIFEKVGKIGLDADSLLRNEANSGRTDGVHPTRNGYRFLALAVSLFIQCQQLPMGRIVCFGDSITRGDGSADRESYPAYLRKLLSNT